MQKVVILGASGMLGCAVLDIFAQDDSCQINATTRNVNLFDKSFNNVNWQVFDAESENIKEQLTEIVNKIDYVINCIGIIKPYAKDDNPEHIKRAIKVNSLLPYVLSDLSQEFGFKVLQIATDCVYCGDKGSYVENDKHDALDVYGKTKSLGEVVGNLNFYNLRCSIIGKEKKSFVSLLEWFLKQPQGSTVSGFTNHDWNGVTTHHFGKICLGVIKNNLQLPVLQHIVAGNIISKYEMLKTFAKYFNRQDLVINTTEATIKVDRTISTNNQSLNQEIWRVAGYQYVPTIEKMIEEISKYK
jgi:dTDP-4-dehydrorhamnose reductase